MDKLKKEMLRAISLGKNPCTRERARKILRGEMSIQTALSYGGGFMTSVLTGDVIGAVQRADLDNRRALRNALGNKFVDLIVE